MIKLSVHETKWSSFLARTRALTLFISTWIFDFGPGKLPGLSRNGPLGRSMGLMYGGSLGQNTSQNPKTLSSIQNTSIQESKIQFPESKKVLDSGTCFVPMSYVTHASGAPLPEPNHHVLNNNNIEKNKSFIVVTSKLYLHNYWVTTQKQHYM